MKSGLEFLLRTLRVPGLTESQYGHKNDSLYLSVVSLILIMGCGLEDFGVWWHVLFDVDINVRVVQEVRRVVVLIQHCDIQTGERFHTVT